MTTTILAASASAIVTLAACAIGVRLARRAATHKVVSVMRDEELSRLRWSVDWGYSTLRDPNTFKVTIVARPVGGTQINQKVIVRYRAKGAPEWDVQHTVDLALHIEDHIVSIDSASYQTEPGEEGLIEVQVSRASDDERIWHWHVPYSIPTASEFATSPQPLISEVNWI